MSAGSRAAAAGTDLDVDNDDTHRGKLPSYIRTNLDEKANHERDQTHEQRAASTDDCLYLRKFSTMRKFGAEIGFVDSRENHPKMCVGEDRIPRGRAPSKLELTKLRYQHTLMPMRHMYAWAVPSTAALELIGQTVTANELQGVVEIGAGTGYWASLLNKQGIDVVAFEANINGSLLHGTPSFINDPIAFADIYKGGPGILRKGAYSSRCLFLCYPPVADRMCVDALQNFGGNYIVYVGALDRLHPLSSSLPECHRPPLPKGVGTGHPEFFLSLGSSCDVVEKISVPSHFFCRDHLVVLRRCKPKKASAPVSDPHEKLTPTWPAASEDHAMEHLFAIEQKNWAVFEKEFVIYVKEHGLNVEINADGNLKDSPVFRMQETYLHLREKSMESQTPGVLACQPQSCIDHEPIDVSQPWKDSLCSLMKKYPDLATEAYFLKLSLFYSVEKKTVKNARARLLKQEKQSAIKPRWWALMA